MIVQLHELRGFCADSDAPITPRIVADWAASHGKKIPPWERDAYFKLDRVLRQARFDVMMYHQGRDRARAERKSKKNGN